ncbi:hypothetical protein [Streptomyces malaysiensis]|uniref:hypothetical protein n=1 Tax=Streptomyces malaysiensis TaxID=92644 RepID=UPI0033DC9BE7
MSRVALATLLPEQPIGLRRADEHWNAVAVPTTWSRLVLANLAGRNGAVFEDARFRHLVWVIPSGGADDWPEAHGMGVIVYRTGEQLAVPGLGGFHGSHWLRTPSGQLLFTDPDELRTAVEKVAGPLADAEQLGPMVVCCYCNTPTRDSKIINTWTSPCDGSVHNDYACRGCDSARGR